MPAVIFSKEKKNYIKEDYYNPFKNNRKDRSPQPPSSKEGMILLFLQLH